MSRREEPPTVTFTKLDIARRQINTAVWLWFNGADIVSVHTLAAAAHRIVLGLSGNPEVIPLPFDAANLPAGLTTKMFAKAQSFLGPAPEDPDKIIELNPILTELYLFLVISAYTEFAIDDDSYHPLMSAFMLRVGICRPEVFRRDALPRLDKGIEVDRIKKLSKSDFLKKMFGNVSPPAP
jgi:hypothetical protein